MKNGKKEIKNFRNSLEDIKNNKGLWIVYFSDKLLNFENLKVNWCIKISSTWKQKYYIDATFNDFTLKFLSKIITNFRLFVENATIESFNLWIDEIKKFFNSKELENFWFIKNKIINDEEIDEIIFDNIIIWNKEEYKAYLKQINLWPNIIIGFDDESKYDLNKFIFTVWNNAIYKHDRNQCLNLSWVKSLFLKEFQPFKLVWKTFSKKYLISDWVSEEDAEKIGWKYFVFESRKKEDWNVFIDSYIISKSEDIVKNSLNLFPYIWRIEKQDKITLTILDLEKICFSFEIINK